MAQASDYHTGETPQARHGQTEGIMEHVSEIGERAETLVGDLGAAIKERPYTTLAIAAGLAFAVGALWKLGQQKPQTRLDSLLSRLPELPDAHSLLPRRWR
jgi:hypothetical protein